MNPNWTNDTEVSSGLISFWTEEPTYKTSHKFGLFGIRWLIQSAVANGEVSNKMMTMASTEKGTTGVNKVFDFFFPYFSNNRGN